MKSQKKKISKQEKNSIIKTITDSLDKYQNVVFAYIYGSFVIDELFSDIDIGIYISNEKIKNTLSLEFELGNMLENLAKLPIDVRIINQAPTSFVYNVIKNGILIRDKNPDLRADFEGCIFKKYSDFARYRKEYLKEILHASI